MTVKLLSAEDLRQHKGVSFVGVCTPFICYDGSGRFFMAKRSKNARDEHGTWDVGSGGLKWGQTAEENALREVKEEYGAESLGVEFLGYRDVFRKLSDGTPTHWLAVDFAVKVDPRVVRINEPDMFDDSGWFTLETLPQPLHSQDAIFFEKYRERLEQLLG